MQTNRPPYPDLNSSSWIQFLALMDGGNPTNHRIPTLVLRKKLTNSDIDPNQGRVFLNKEFMEKELIPKILKGNEASLMQDDINDGLPIVAVGPALQPCRVAIKWWKSIKQYAVKKKWMEVVERNELKEGDSICIWAFRSGDDGELFLFIEVE